MSSLLGNWGFQSAEKQVTSGGAGTSGLPYSEQGQSEYVTPSEEKTLAMTHDQSPEKTTSSSSEDDEEEKRDRRVLELARSFSEAETSDPFNFEKDSHLDPTSANFKPRAWAKALINLQNKSPEHYQQRTAGFAFKNLNVWGFGADSDYQKTVSNVGLQVIGIAKKVLGNKGRKINILQNMDGVVHNGEMLVVLGPPGSGCSTFLKTISGDINGFFVDPESYINYQGISPQQMHKDFHGEAIYTAEVDVHFPMMTVGETLSFAALARAPQVIPGGLKRHEYANILRDVIMAVFGISHTVNTKVGNDFVRGVSGGERKRVTIAEAALSGAPLQCWDNSTRGLDSANAVEFCKTLRMNSDLSGTTSAVAIYQSPQVAYDVFDKVTVLYEGRQIYFGKTTEAKAFFVNMGFHCPDRQTTPDFLTSMTSPIERVVEEGWEDRVPRTPDEFALRWKESPERAALLREVDTYDKEHTIGGPSLEAFKDSRRKQQSKHQRIKSPYTLSYYGQVKLCLHRGFQRLKADPSLTFTQLFANFIMALVVGSVFYNLNQTTTSFYSRGALLFFAILLNAFGSALEILTLYAQRPIVEKQSRYAFYHPSAEAFASMLTDMPYKILNTFTFNLALYFMTNLRRTPGAFFFFVLISFFLTLSMSMLFRTIASVSRTLSQAMAPAAILILAIIIYTGFALPIPSMHGWARWINYIDLVAYGFESLMVNEFWGREFPCADISYIPSYGDLSLGQKVCNTVGSVPGQDFVDGGVYIQTAYKYTVAHKWRNFGIIIVFMLGLMACYLLATEFITEKKSKGEILLFRRGQVPASLKKQGTDEEAGNEKPVGASALRRDVSHIIDKQTAIFHWEDMCYDIKIKGEPRRILDNVDGWVKPGTLTALMGVSGAGKTTLLDVLATRTTMGVISGEAYVDGRTRDTSFQRKTGYVQQQDLHLQTQTVREALLFSAMLRQPAHVSNQEKAEYVSQVIELLDMTEYADAIVGVPGEGLNVEQRKRLTIGVELAAKPQLLLFLDEPTSGLDSQTSWAILDLLEKLKQNGQAILCTIHQPSAVLFQRFDRLLFLKSGGQTVYFGPVGESSSVLTEYFESNGAKPCPPDANPAEWMLEVIGAAPGSHSDIDWHSTWRKSPQYQAMKQHLGELREVLPQTTKPSIDPNDKSSYREFAAHFQTQQWLVTKRVFEQYWRTPSYIYSKVALCTLSTLFIGFSFYNAGTSLQALQNQLFSIFTLFTIFGQLVQQIMPHFVTQRSLYEARERPSKAYSWKAFMLANIVVEIAWNGLMAVIMFFCWYYPIGLYKNAEPTGEVHSRGILMFLLVLCFMLFTSTFTTMVIAAIPTAETAGNIGNLLFSLTLIFCGVLVSPGGLPRFWIFMYRVSPFTYLVSALISTGLANAPVVCADYEFVNFNPPANMTCQAYSQLYIDRAGGYLQDPTATTACAFCPINSTNQFLLQVSASYENRWRDFGILWGFIIFNVFMAVFLYWIARVPKGAKKAKKE